MRWRGRQVGLRSARGCGSAAARMWCCSEVSAMFDSCHQAMVSVPSSLCHTWRSCKHVVACTQGSSRKAARGRMSSASHAAPLAALPQLSMLPPHTRHKLTQATCAVNPAADPHTTHAHLAQQYPRSPTVPAGQCGTYHHQDSISHLCCTRNALSEHTAWSSAALQASPTCWSTWPSRARRQWAARTGAGRRGCWRRWMKVGAVCSPACWPTCAHGMPAESHCFQGMLHPFVWLAAATACGDGQPWCSCVRLPCVHV
jgi:hypothetical protein